MIFIALILKSCNDVSRMETYENQFDKFLSELNTKDSIYLRLDTISGFDWDSLLIVGPYEDIDNISLKEGLDLSGIPNVTKHHDRYILIGFLKNKKAKRYMELQRNSFLDQLLKNENTGHKIFAKEKSRFIIKGGNSF